ncbi:endosomal sorting complex protein [Moniliophthora roreri]|nr:endosomal sorting complex protein [Moniliophthora roreri]
MQPVYSPVRCYTHDPSHRLPKPGELGEDPDFNSSIPYPESHPDAAQNDV